MLHGIAASAGVGVGRATLVRTPDLPLKRHTASSQADEQKRFLNAVGTFCAQALKNYYYARDHIGEKEAAIITAQIVIVTDPELHKNIIAHIRQNNHSAEYALTLVCDQFIDRFQNMSNELMRERGADFWDIKTQLLHILLGIPMKGLNHLPNGSVLVARDVSPSQAVTINPHRVSAIVTEEGGSQSHLSIIARSLKIPVVVGVRGVMDAVRPGDRLLVDGDAGNIIKNPDVAQYKDSQRAGAEHTSKRDRWPVVVSTANSHIVS